jgi:hypothetical protein
LAAAESGGLWFFGSKITEASQAANSHKSTSERCWGLWVSARAVDRILRALASFAEALYALNITRNFSEQNYSK